MFFTCASGMHKPLGSKQLLKSSNSLEWTCYSMTRRKCYWTLLRENHHRNEFASSTCKDQKDSWCSLPRPFSAVLHRKLFIFTVYKSPTWLWSHWEMRYLSQWAYRVTTNSDILRCPHTCVHVFCSLCVSIFNSAKVQPDKSYWAERELCIQVVSRGLEALSLN